MKNLHNISNNVEVAEAETRSYGDVQIVRGMYSGIVSAIHPLTLQNNCKGALSAEFMHHANPDEFPKPELPLHASMEQKANLTLEEQCAVDARAFVDEAKQEGLELQPFYVPKDKSHTIIETTAYATRPKTPVPGM